MRCSVLRSPRTVLVVTLILLLGLLLTGMSGTLETLAQQAGTQQAGTQQAGTQQYEYKNLQVLPKDIAREDLGRVMRENTDGLGLRGPDEPGCLYCHVGDPEKPRSTWDWASDEKPEKQTARLMMRMVQDINQKHLAGLESRIDPESRVTCATCHAGRTDPRPLETIVLQAYEMGGVELAEHRYRGLRARYYGSNAYDFSPELFRRIVSQVARTSLDDALVLSEMQEDLDGDSARQGTVRLLESWLEAHPDDPEAKRKLQELQSRP